MFFENIAACQRCELRQTATHVVVGSGRLNAKLFIVGEAPGKIEDKRGVPFVGVSGKYMWDQLLAAGFKGSHFYVTNVVKCRPPENMDPPGWAIEACKPHLDIQIRTLNPILIIPVGRFALKYFSASLKLSEVHGTEITVKGRPLFPLYHPAYALRKVAARKMFGEDVLALKETLLKMMEASEQQLFTVR